jgi:transposase
MSNGLENEEVIKNGILVGLISEDKVAVRFGVGVETVRTWAKLGRIKGIQSGNRLYFLDNIADPRKN